MLTRTDRLPRFLADENFNNDILRGLLRQMPNLDILRVQDVGLSGMGDPDVLEWAAKEGRVLLTHDVTTMAGFAYNRIDANQLMPGVLEVSRSLRTGPAIESILLMVAASFESEWVGQVRYLSLL